MNRYRKYLVIFLITFFIAGTMASVAMANCGQGQHKGDSVVMDMSCCADNSAVDHVDHKADSSSTHAASNTLNCNNCDGSLCTAQALVPVYSSLGLYIVFGVNLIPEDINLTFIFLDRIPDPPKQVS